MYKKIMVFGMVLLIMLCTPLPSFAFDYPAFTKANCNDSPLFNKYMNGAYTIIFNYPELSSPDNQKVYVYQTKQPLIINKNIGKGELCITSSGTSFPAIFALNGFMPDGSRLPNYSIQEINSTYLGNSNSKINILYSSYTVYDTEGQQYFYNSGSIPANGFDGRITLPANDGYKDNGTTFTFWHWYQLPTGVDSSDVKIDPYIDDSKDTYHSAAVTLHQKIPNTSKWNLNINLTVREYGPHTYKVVFKQISTGKVLGTLTRTFEALEGFIDENGDGLDDRTGQPPYDPLEPPGDSLTPEWDGTILGFFQYLIDSVKYYVQNIVDGINVTMGAIGKVPQIMGTILNFPEPLTALLIFGVTCTIILAIFRR